MTGPEDPTREQRAAEPSVGAASPPGEPRRWWSRIPHHLGRARTSTVVLGLLFVSVFALYLNVRPAPEAPRTAGGDSAVTEPATTTGGTTTPPPPTSEPPPTTVEEPTTTEEPTTSPAPEEDGGPDGTTESVPPTGTTAPSPPTTSAPTG